MFAERLCKEETTRWEKRGAILRTKRKLKAPETAISRRS